MRLLDLAERGDEQPRQRRRGKADRGAGDDVRQIMVAARRLCHRDRGGGQRDRTAATGKSGATAPATAAEPALCPDGIERSRPSRLDPGFNW